MVCRLCRLTETERIHVGRSIHRAFKVYKTVESALRRDGFTRPGALATELLQMFLERDGEIRSTKFISKKICDDGEFSILRRKLIEKRWIIWSESQSYKARCYAGKRIIPFINREKIASEELVTKNDIIPKAVLESELQSTKAKLSDVERRLSKIEATIDRGITRFLEKNPPDTPSRRRRVRETFESTGEIALN